METIQGRKLYEEIWYISFIQIKTVFLKEANAPTLLLILVAKKVNQKGFDGHQICSYIYNPWLARKATRSHQSAPIPRVLTLLLHQYILLNQYWICSFPTLYIYKLYMVPAFGALERDCCRSRLQQSFIS